MIRSIDDFSNGQAYVAVSGTDQIIKTAYNVNANSVIAGTHGLGGVTMATEHLAGIRNRQRRTRKEGDEGEDRDMWRRVKEVDRKTTGDLEKDEEGKRKSKKEADRGNSVAEDIKGRTGKGHSCAGSSHLGSDVAAKYSEFERPTTKDGHEATRAKASSAKDTGRQTNTATAPSGD